MIILPYIIVRLKKSNDIQDTAQGSKEFGSIEVNMAIIRKTMELN